MRCEECGVEIPTERLEALPETTTCVKHSRVKPIMDYPSYRHKPMREALRDDDDDREEPASSAKVRRR